MALSYDELVAEVTRLNAEIIRLTDERAEILRPSPSPTADRTLAGAWSAIDDLRRTWALQERRLRALEPDGK